MEGVTLVELRRMGVVVGGAGRLRDVKPSRFVTEAVEHYIATADLYVRSRPRRRPLRIEGKGMLKGVLRCVLQRHERERNASTLVNFNQRSTSGFILSPRRSPATEDSASASARLQPSWKGALQS